jgi:small subunit ribosomal protein S17
MSKKILEGIVLNNKADKTVTVLVERKVLHEKYKKITKRSKKYLAHDEGNVLNIGDKVKIIESKPISKLKKWQILLNDKG